DPAHPHRVRHADPRHEDVREDHEAVDEDEDPDEFLDSGDRVREQTESGVHAHRSWILRQTGASYAGYAPVALLADQDRYAWLKKPPRSRSFARSSAETSTLRG